MPVSGDHAGHADPERQTTGAVCISQPSDAESRKTRLVPELHSFFVVEEIGFFPLFPRFRILWPLSLCLTPPVDTHSDMCTAQVRISAHSCPMCARSPRERSTLRQAGGTSSAASMGSAPEVAGVSQIGT